jgi:hypothetical protein
MKRQAYIKREYSNLGTSLWALDYHSLNSTSTVTFFLFIFPNLIVSLFSLLSRTLTCLYFSSLLLHANKRVFQSIQLLGSVFIPNLKVVKLEGSTSVVLNHCAGAQ